MFLLRVVHDGTDSLDEEFAVDEVVVEEVCAATEEEPDDNGNDDDVRW